MEALLKFIGVIAYILFSIFCITPLAALGTQYLWTWFVIPAFDIATPSIWILCGLFLIWNVFSLRASFAEKVASSEFDAGEQFVFGIQTSISQVCTIWLSVLIGYVYHCLA